MAQTLVRQELLARQIMFAQCGIGDVRKAECIPDRRVGSLSSDGRHRMRRVADQRCAVSNVRVDVTERSRDTHEVPRELELLAQRWSERRNLLHRPPEILRRLFERALRLIRWKRHQKNAFVLWPG